MIDFGITGVWCSSPKEFRDEFKAEFNEVVDDTRDGLHTYVFCEYHDNSAYAEVLYALVLNKRVIFCYDTTQYELSLDEKFSVRGFHVNDDSGYMFLNSVFLAGDVHYMGNQCDQRGNLYRIFAIDSQSQIDGLLTTYDHEYPIENIKRLDSTDVLNMCIEFMEYKSTKFSDEIDLAKSMGEPTEGMSENPFQDKFYDREFKNLKEEAPKIYE